MNTQYKLLKTMEKCERNGEALESDMRKLWKKCPARDEILNMGAGELFSYNFDLTNPGYALTWQGREYIREHEQASRSSAIAILTLLVAIATLLVSLG